MTGGGSGSPTVDVLAEVASPEMASEMATETMIAPYRITEFAVGDLPALPGNTTGYVFDAATAPSADEVARVAAALGVAGDPEQIDDGYSVYWRLGPDDGSAPSVTLWGDAMRSWDYDWGWAAHEGEMIACETVAMPAGEPETGATIELGDGETTVGSIVPEPAPATTCPEPEPVVGLPSAAEAEQKVAEMLAAMGVDTAAIAFDTYADDWATSVDAAERLDGVATRHWGFSFGENAELQHAWGNAATPEPVGPYPLIDLDAAIARLDSDQFGWGGVPMAEPALLDAPADSDVSVSNDAAVDDGASVSEPMPVDVAEAPVEPIENTEVPSDTLALITVTLVDVEADLWWVWDADGSAWLVPAYRFIGDDGGWYTVPAVTDDYLIVAQPTGLPTTEPAPEPPPTTAPPVAQPPATVPVDPTSPDQPPTTVALIDLGAMAGWELVDFTEVAGDAGWTVRVIEYNGEPLDADEDYRVDRVNVAVVADGEAEYVVRVTLDDGTVLGEAEVDTGGVLLAADFEELVGLTLDEFTAAAAERGAETRVVMRDLVGLDTTEDFRTDRVNVEVETVDGVEMVTGIVSIG